MPAVVARRCNPVLKAFGDRLAAAGLAPKAVIGAVMGKLLVLAYGVVKSGKPFDPAYGTVAPAAPSRAPVEYSHAALATAGARAMT